MLALGYNEYGLSPFCSLYYQSFLSNTSVTQGGDWGSKVYFTVVHLDLLC